MADLHKPLRAFHIHLHCRSQVFVETDGGGRVEYQRDIVNQELKVSRREAQAGERDVTGYGHQFGHYLRPVAPHLLKHL